MTPLEMLRDYQRGEIEKRPAVTPPATTSDTPDQLDRDLSSWPPTSRYLVAELERYGMKTEVAVAVVRAATHNATAAGEERMEVTR